MKLLNATNLDRKSGIRGPKTMGEALRQPFVRDPTNGLFIRSEAEGSAVAAVSTEARHLERTKNTAGYTSCIL
jgi:hypothetical protein